MRKQLTSNLYSQSPNRVLSVSNYVDLEGAEVEDLFPAEFLSDELDRIERDAETPLGDTIQSGVPFVEQVERWAHSQSVSVDVHWKVKLSIRAKRRALTMGLKAFDDSLVERWIKLFNCFARSS